MRRSSWVRLASVATAPLAGVLALLLAGSAVGGPGSGESSIATPTQTFPTPAVVSGDQRCAAGWSVYHHPDDRFSLCIAPGWRSEEVPVERFGSALTLEGPSAENGLPLASVTAYWAPSSPVAAGVTTDRCLPVSHWQDVRETTFVIDGREVIGCEGDATDYGHPNPGGPVRLRGTFAEVPDGEGGYVVVFAVEQEAERSASGTVEAVLRTLDVGEAP